MTIKQEKLAPEITRIIVQVRFVIVKVYCNLVWENLGTVSANFIPALSERLASLSEVVLGKMSYFKMML